MSLLVVSMLPFLELSCSFVVQEKGKLKLAICSRVQLANIMKAAVIYESGICGKLVRMPLLRANCFAGHQ